MFLRSNSPAGAVQQRSGLTTTWSNSPAVCSPRAHYFPFKSSSLQMSNTNARRVLCFDCLVNAAWSHAKNAGSSNRSRVICAICANCVRHVCSFSVTAVVRSPVTLQPRWRLPVKRRTAILFCFFPKILPDALSPGAKLNTLPAISSELACRTESA